jgi:hypothetical protein
MSAGGGERERLLRRDLEKSREAERKAELPLNRKLAKIKRTLKARSSGKPTPRLYRVADADDRFLRAVKASLDEGEQVFLTNRTGGPVEDFRSQSYRKRHDRSIPRNTIKRTYWCPHWDHATDGVRSLAWSMVAHRQGAHAMSVNLGDDVIADLKAKGPGFAKRLLGRMRLYLRRYLEPLGIEPPEMFFWVESRPGEREHIHGAIILPPNRPDANKTVKSALAAAGGNWTPKGNQVDLRHMHNPQGWLTYITKWQRGTIIRLGDPSVAAATMDLRKSARRWYEEARTGAAPIA